MRFLCRSHVVAERVESERITVNFPISYYERLFNYMARQYDIG